MHAQPTAALNVFISHKHEYEEAANGFKETLGLFGGPALKVFISEEIPAGTDWFRWIRERLAESNLLLLLFTEKGTDWDWPLYEAGLFTNLAGDDYRRVICLHHPFLERPTPLKHLQAVRATPERMARFLRNLFGGTEITGLPAPLNPPFAGNEAELERRARALCGLLVPHAVQKRHYDRYLDLRVSEPEKIGQEEIPLDSIVTSDRRSLEIFGLAEGPHTWRDIEARARQSADGDWTRTFARSVHQARCGEIPDPVHCRFRTKSGVFYRPEIYRSDENSDGSMVFHVLFIEELEGELTGMPDDLRALATAVKFASRFRWEILEKYGRPDLTDEDVDALAESMQRIETDALAHGLLDQDLVVQQFDEEDGACIERMYERWREMRDETGTGALDRAIAERDAGQIGPLLQELVPMNRTFTEMVARRFADTMAVAH